MNENKSGHVFSVPFISVALDTLLQIVFQPRFRSPLQQL